MPKFSVILPAAGRSSRFKDQHYKKPFAVLNQKPVWLHSADRFLKRSDVKQLSIVIAPADREDFYSKFGPNLAVMGIDVVVGGAERADSIQHALDHVNSDCDFVVIHDAVRPCLDDELIERVFVAATKHRAAIAAIPINSTIKRSTDGKSVLETVDRNGLWLAQTPQVFSRDLIVDCYAKRGTLQPTDESQLLEKLGHPVFIVVGSPLNVKITEKQDMRLAQACLEALPKPRFDAPTNLWR